MANSLSVGGSTIPLAIEVLGKGGVLPDETGGAMGSMGTAKVPGRA
jgi:hypothetical protein